jgi:WD40 repeat protein
VLYYDRAGNVRVYDTAVAKEPETPVRRTPRAVRTVAFSPHGKWLAAGGDSKTVQLVDLTTRGVFLTLRGHLGIVTGLAFSPDGKRVASCSPDATARIWDLDAGRAVLTLDGRGQGFLAIAFSPDGKQVATAGEDGEVRLWATSDGRPGAVLSNHVGAVHALAFSSDGRWLVSAGDDRSVRVWDAREGHETKTLRGHQDKVACVAFSPDGRRIVSGGWDQLVIVWDREKGEPLTQIREHADKISAVGFSPDGQRIASAAWDGIALVWEAATGQRLLQCGSRHRWGSADEADHRLNCLAFCGEGKRLALGYTDGSLPVCHLAPVPDATVKKDHRLRRGAAGEPSEDGDAAPEITRAAASFAAYGPGGIRGHLDITIYTMAVTSIVFAPDGKRFATLSKRHQLKVWKWPELTEVFRAGGTPDSVEPLSETVEPLSRALEPLSAALFSSDSRRLAATGGQKVTVWDSGTGEVISVRDLEGPCELEGPTVFSADGKRVAKRPYNKNFLRLWDATTGKSLPALEGFDVGGIVLAFHPDCTRLLTGDYDWTLRVWSLADRKMAFVARGHCGSPACGAFTPEGKRLASVGDRTLRTWDSETGTEITAVPIWDRVHHLAFHPAGTRVATEGAGNTVVVRDVTTGRRLLVCRGHSTPVHSIAFHPDGRALLSGDGEGMVKVWKKAASQEAAPQGK